MRTISQKLYRSRTILRAKLPFSDICTSLTYKEENGNDYKNPLRKLGGLTFRLTLLTLNGYIYLILHHFQTLSTVKFASIVKEQQVFGRHIIARHLSTPNLKHLLLF